MVRGIDGCHAGWFAASLDEMGVVSAKLFQSAEPLLETKVHTISAIDIPIGLPSDGPRQCDIEARKILRDRRSSVFPAPVRATLAARSYEDACAISERTTRKKLSKQAYAILPKIREVDECLRNNLAEIWGVREVHPEVCFTFWNKQQPMKHPKSTGFGFVERFKLVEKRFPGAADRFRHEFRARDVSDDDILDALAALWSAIRIESGTAVCIGPEDAKDELGLPMNMWA